MNGMGQASSIHDNMPLNAGNFLTGVIAFFSGGISILYALSVNDT
jgi:hypothetical protein